MKKKTKREVKQAKTENQQTKSLEKEDLKAVTGGFGNSVGCVGG
jgi:hypothetical protein